MHILKPELPFWESLKFSSLLQIGTQGERGQDGTSGEDGEKIYNFTIT